MIHAPVQPFFGNWLYWQAGALAPNVAPGCAPWLCLGRCAAPAASGLHAGADLAFDGARNWQQNRAHIVDESGEPLADHRQTTQHQHIVEVSGKPVGRPLILGRGLLP